MRRLIVNNVFCKQRNYLYKNLKIIIIAAIVFFTILLIQDKPVYPLLIFVGVYILLWAMLEIRKYKYSSVITVDENKIEEGKFSTSWDEVSFVHFTTSRSGPFIDIRINKKRHTVIAEEYERSLELRDLIESICVRKGINHKVDDRASYKHDNTEKTTHMNPWNALLGVVTAWGLPIVLILFFVVIGLLVQRC